MYKFFSKYRNFQIVINGVNIKFDGGKFNTEDETLANLLQETTSFGVSFFRVDDGFSNDTAWKENLQKTDKIELWNKTTKEKFKQGETIHRCRNKCGYACHMLGPLRNHEKNCHAKEDN